MQQSKSGTHTIQTKRKPSNGYVVNVKWINDEVEFKDRMAHAISQKTGIPTSSLRYHVSKQGGSIFSDLELRNPRRGESVRIVVSSISYSSDILQSIDLSVGTKEVKEPSATKDLPTVSVFEKPQDKDTPEVKLRHNVNFVIRTLNQYVSKADQEGYDGAKITIEKKNNVVFHSFERLGMPQIRSAGTTPISPAIVETQIRPLIEAIAIAPDGLYLLNFQRDEMGIMRHHRFERQPQISTPKIENVHQPSEPYEDEELRWYKEIAKSTFQVIETGKEMVKEAAEEQSKISNVAMMVLPATIATIQKARKIRDLTELERVCKACPSDNC